MKYSLYLWFLVIISCNNPNSKTPIPLRIATAANLQFTLQAIEPIFEKETKIPIDLIFSSSGKLTAQIEQGAPYHLFLSANLKYPELLFEKGLAIQKPKVYALGKLVKWSLQDSVFVNNSEIFLQKECKKIAIANPKNAPYGEQSLAALKNLEYFENVKSKLVFGESIAQTNQFINSKAVEVGFTSKSVVLSPKMKNVGFWKDVEDNLYQPIEQGVIITKYGAEKNIEAAETFLNFLSSEKVKTIFEEYGYEIPREN